MQLALNIFRINCRPIAAFCLWLVFGSTLASPHLQAKEHSKILQVAYVEFPPIEYNNEKNTPDGVFIDITKAVLNNANLEFEFVFLPISRTYLYLREGQIDLWPGLSGIPALQGHVLESQAIPLTITLSAWHLADTPAINSVAELSGKRAILINGYTYGGLLYKITNPDLGITPLYTPNHLSGLKMLERGRGEYLLDYNEPILNQLETYPLEGLKHSVLNRRNASFVVSKKIENAEWLSNIIDQSYKELRDNGKLELYFNKKNRKDDKLPH